MDSSLDLGGITPPAMLTVSIKDRRATLFELVWTAPSINGQPATSYQVRYAKVPITSANFNDTTITTAAPYVGTPAQPGNTDGTTVKLYIENSYYFAIQGTNSTGGGTIDGTTTPIIAHFNETSLAGTGPTNEQFGSVFDGSGDLNGDGFSDVLVGSTAGQHAYIFFGTRGTSQQPPRRSSSRATPRRLPSAGDLASLVTSTTTARKTSRSLTSAACRRACSSIRAAAHGR